MLVLVHNIDICQLKIYEQRLKNIQEITNLEKIFAITNENLI